MQKHPVYIFYAEENSIEAQQIVEDLQKTNIDCITTITTAEKVEQLTQNEAAVGLVILSDNYLKSIDETRHLEVLLKDEFSGRLLPVLTHGRRPKEGYDNQVEVYPTKIQTLNNVMYYRDYWYEEWIRLRKKSKFATGAEEEDLAEKKEIAKKMSVGSISTYIRKMNGLTPKDWDVLSDDGYQLLFDKLGMGDTSVEERFSYYGNGQATETPVEEPETIEDVVEAAAVVEETTATVEEKTVVEETTTTTTVEETAVVEKEIEEKVEEPKEEEVVAASVEPEVKEEEKAEVEVKTEAVEEKAVEEEEHPETPEMEEETAPDEPTETVAETVEEVKEETVVEAETPEEPKEEAFELQELDNLEHVDANTILAEHNIEEVNDIDVLFHIAESEAEEGDFDNARHAYERILQVDPYNGRALIWLARLLARHYDNESLEAAQTYRKAIMLNDENAHLYHEYALLQKDAFQAYYKASDSFREALDIDPTFEDAYLGLAMCQKEMGMTDQAKANYLQACVLDQERFQTTEHDAYFGVIRAAVEEEAVTDTEAAVEDAKPKSPNADTTVLVTGASSGIGRRIAEQFIVNGYKVIITGRRADRLETFKGLMESEFEETQIHCLPFDVCDLDAVKAALESLPEGWADVDVLINNAGLAKGFAPVYEGNVEHWETMIDTNIKGLLYMTRMISPNMVKRQKGHIINLGSVAGKQAYAGGGVYCATKAAVDSLTRSMRLDLYEHNIKVTSVCPGHVDETEFAQVRFDDTEKAKIYDDFKPLSAADVAETIYYVATRHLPTAGWPALLSPNLLC